jgi:hypothetical protein
MTLALAETWLEDYQQRVPERTLEMARLYVEAGQSYSEIAEQFGLTKQRVGQLLGPLGLQQYRRQAAAVRVQLLREAYGRIVRKESTLKVEAPRLGYKNARSLRSALYDLDMRVVLGHVPPRHGTASRYRSRRYSCRCEECTRANREKGNELKGKEPPRHGYSGYLNYACRCQECKEEYRLATRAKRAAKRRRKEAAHESA